MSSAERFNQAVECQRAGDLEAARQLYEGLLAEGALSPTGLNNLALIDFHQGRGDLAVQRLQGVVVAAPDYVEAWDNLGSVCRQVGRLQEALAAYEQAVCLRPKHAGTLYKLGMVQQDIGDLEAAARWYSVVLDVDPGHHGAIFQRSLVRLKSGQQAAALDDLHRSVQLNPTFATGWTTLGETLYGMGRYAEAIDLLTYALDVLPDSLAIAHELVRSLLRTGRTVEALELLQQCIAAAPDDTRFWVLLCRCRMTQGQFAPAETACREALGRWPDDTQLLTLLALTLRSQDRFGEADAVYEKAFAIEPHVKGRIDWALAASPLPANVAEIEAAVSQAIERLDACIQRPCPQDRLLTTGFYFAYFGVDITPLQRRMGQALLASRPYLGWVPTWFDEWQARGVQGRRLRVGFISTLFCQPTHIISRCYASLAAQLDRSRFEVVLIQVGGQPMANELAASCESAVHLAQPDVESAVTALRDLRLDALVYTDIGMDQATAQLAIARVAPVQMAMDGHPVTTGSPNMDYYLSSKWYEPEDAANHYTEQLVLFGDSPCFLARPTATTTVDLRAELGLRPDVRLYACLQSLFKLHPDFDQALAQILRSDPQAICLLVNDRQRDAWEQRFARSYGDVADRIHFLARRPLDQFHGVLLDTDVLLDPWHFGGGTTTMTAFGLGLPVVTLPAPFVRGRFTYGLYRKMGINDLIAADAQDYVAKALRLAADRDWFRDLQRRILAANDFMFESGHAVRELETILVSTIEAAVRGVLLRF
jgi:predicted O-linked N-acetylglucosamine transferase (SPINDLY family)